MKLKIKLIKNLSINLNILKAIKKRSYDKDIVQTCSQKNLLKYFNKNQK
jgi:hypothetical protein